MVQLRYSVVTTIELLIARGLVGLGGVGTFHGTLERVTTDNGVDVSTGDIRINNRVRSLNGEGYAIEGEDLLAWSA